MMQLSRRMNKYELKAEPQKFPFPASIFKRIIRVDELHPSTECDTHYVFLLWVKPEDHDAVVKEIVDFVEEEAADWTTTIHEEGFGEGLVVISTYV